jgi:hypothetical protein
VSHPCYFIIKFPICALNPTEYNATGSLLQQINKKKTLCFNVKDGLFFNILGLSSLSEVLTKRMKHNLMQADIKYPPDDTWPAKPGTNEWNGVEQLCFTPEKYAPLYCISPGRL